MAIESNREDQAAELQTLRSVKAFLTQKLSQNEEILKSLQKDMVGLSQDLQKEKREKLKLEQQYLQLFNEREDYAENIKDLNMQYKNVVEPKHLTLAY